MRIGTAEGETRAEGRRSTTKAGRIAASRGRWALRGGLVAALLLVVAYGATAFILDSVVDGERIGAWLSPRASGALNRPVEVGSARLSVFPRPAVRVSDVLVGNLSDFDGPALAYVEEVRFDVSWLPLLFGKVAVRRVTLDSARVYLAIDADGVSNFGDLMPEPRAPMEELPAGPLDLRPKDIVVSNGSLTFFDAPGGRSFALTGASMDAALAPAGPSGVEGWRATIEARADSLQLRVVSMTDEILRTSGPSLTLALLGGDQNSIDIEEGSLAFGDEALAVSGRIVGLGQEYPSYQIEVANPAMAATALASLFPGEARAALVPHAEGTLDVAFRVRGAPRSRDLPLVDGSVGLRDVRLRLGGTLVAEDVVGTVTLDADTVSADSLRGRFAGGPFTLTGSYSRHDRGIWIETVARPDLDALDQLGLVPGGTALSGSAALDISVTGHLDALDSVSVAGTAALEGVRARHARFGVPLYVPAGTLDLRGQTVRWSELIVLVGEDRITTSGSLSDVVALWTDDWITPDIDMDVRGERLDLGAVLPAATDGPEATYAEVAWAHLGRRRVQGETTADVAIQRKLSLPERPPLTGSVRIALDRLDFRRYRLDSLDARIELQDTTARFLADSFDIWGGEGHGALALGLGPAAGQPFTFAVAVDGIDASQFLPPTTPLPDDAVTGRLTLDFEVRGAMDASLLPLAEGFSGEGRLSIVDGRFAGTGVNMAIADFLGNDGWLDVAFESWRTDFVFRERTMEVRQGLLVGEQGRVAYDGFMELDGTHDFAMAISIPAGRLSETSLRRTGIGPSVLEQLRRSDSPLDLGLRMSGSIGAPYLEPDAANALSLASAEAALR